MFSSTLLIAALLAAPTPASSVSEGKEKDGFSIIHAAELKTLLADKDHPVALFDANHPEFRQENGVIAGAKLLDSPHDYDLKSTLPADKSARLVFYCSSRL